MRILLVYPNFPRTYWGFQDSLWFIGKKASLPPLGLISVAALLPGNWEFKLVDLNIESLHDRDIRWADVVMTGGMRIQAPSIHDVIRRAHALDRKVVVGGPAPTTSPAEFEDADCCFLGEAEGKIQGLIEALGANGRLPRILPADSGGYPEMREVPVPRFDLLDWRQYASMSIQYSRGCPFTCEFCDIIEIFGRIPRVKAPAQVLAELEALRSTGYRGSIFFVDDNFIGNKKAVREFLPELKAWQARNRHPFEFYTEASVNLADDLPLVEAMVDSHFTSVFLGIETPSVEALKLTQKRQNAVVDLTLTVDRLTRAGLEVMGGFIVGFDTDDPTIFEAQRAFISSIPVPLAMVGLLTALPGTALWRRLAKEGRIRETATGDQFGRPNFEPAMDERTLLAGYAQLLGDVYRPENYYARCWELVSRWPEPRFKRLPTPVELGAFFRAIGRIGIAGRRRKLFWELLLRTLRQRPQAFTLAVTRAIMGEHLIRYTDETVKPRVEAALEALPGSVSSSVAIAS